MNNTLYFLYVQTSNSVLSCTIAQDHNTQYNSMSVAVEEILDDAYFSSLLYISSSVKSPNVSY